MKGLSARFVIWSTLAIIIVLYGAHCGSQYIANRNRRNTILSLCNLEIHIRSQYEADGIYPDNINDVPISYEDNDKIRDLVRYKRSNGGERAILLWTFQKGNDALMDQLIALPIEECVMLKDKYTPERICGAVYDKGVTIIIVDVDK